MWTLCYICIQKFSFLTTSSLSFVHCDRHSLWPSTLEVNKFNTVLENWNFSKIFTFVRSFFSIILMIFEQHSTLIELYRGGISLSGLARWFMSGCVALVICVRNASVFVYGRYDTYRTKGRAVSSVSLVCHSNPSHLAPLYVESPIYFFSNENIFI